MSTSVHVLWAVGLVVAYASLPLVLVYLTRILWAARKTANYLRETRAHSALLPKHLAVLPALDDTTALLETARNTGASIATGAETLVGALLQRAGAKP